MVRLATRASGLTVVLLWCGECYYCGLACEGLLPLGLLLLTFKCTLSTPVYMLRGMEFERFVFRIFVFWDFEYS